MGLGEWKFEHDGRYGAPGQVEVIAIIGSSSSIGSAMRVGRGVSTIILERRCRDRWLGFEVEL